MPKTTSGRIVLSLAIATALSLLGQMAVSYPIELPFSFIIRNLGPTLVEGPGGVFAAVLAVCFSPQGGHGLEDFMFTAVPFTWLFYFALTCWIVFRFVPGTHRK